MVIAFIDAHRDQFGVGPACTVLREHGVQIAASTYYAAGPGAVNPRDPRRAAGRRDQARL